MSAEAWLLDVAARALPPGETHLAAPVWVTTLRALLEEFSAEPPPDPDPTDRSPFDELVLPVVRFAVKRVDALHGSRIAAVFAPAAVTALARRLRERLTAIALPALWHDFLRRRPPQGPFGEVLRRIRHPPGDAEYRAFVERHRADGLVGLFDEYPVLARLACTAVEQWIDGTRELAERLAADRDELARVFPDCRGRVTGIGRETSDPHRGGRSVTVLVFEAGGEVVYKCRGVGMEAGYAALLGWCNALGRLRAELRVLRVLEREDYGWVERVSAAPCATPEAAERFYRRAGMQACLLYALRATDCHADNWIAAGEQPVLVDAETLLAPAAEQDEAVSAAVRDTVLATAVLPCRQYDADAGVLWDSGGIAEAPGDGTVERRVTWRFVATDAMHLGFEELPVSAPAVPRLGEKPLTPGPYATTFVAGFTEMYEFLRHRRAALVAPGGPVAELHRRSSRIVHRPTGVYKALLRQAVSPESLRSGADRSRVFDMLDALGGTPALRAREREALERLDVPYFTGQARGSALGALDPADSERQISLVEGAFAAHAARLGATRSEPVHAAETESGVDLAASAHALARALVARAVWDGATPTWTGPVLLAGADRFQWRDVGDDLYDGRAGVALFLAALDAHLGMDTHREHVAAALAPLRASPDGRYVGTDVGAGKGTGSFVYALTLVARFTGEPSYLADALGLARHLTEATVRVREDHGLLVGRAGAVLSLLALHGATREAWLLDRACALGSRLAPILEHESPDAAGFAAGRAGIAYALAAVSSAVGDATGLAVARAALHAAEAAPGDSSWCRGSVGVDLARLAASRMLASSAAELDRSAASGAAWLRAAESPSRTAVHSLCCGEAGAIERDLVASSALGRPALALRARRRAGHLVARAAREGEHPIFLGTPVRPFMPGFFQGVSGIGYTLLRVLDPVRFPCVALWD
jgi:lantibiotic modifying enzyme